MIETSSVEDWAMTEQITYQIRVQGWMGERWSSRFDDMTIVREGEPDGAPVTALTGLVPDQAALRGILNQLWDLNLTLISVTRTDASRERER
jgi:hypothetical protein